jgi:hypothetical protein
MATPTPLDPEKFIPFTLYALLIGIAAALTVEVIKDAFEPPTEVQSLFCGFSSGSACFYWQSCHGYTISGCARSLNGETLSCR